MEGRVCSPTCMCVCVMESVVKRLLQDPFYVPGKMSLMDSSC